MANATKMKAHLLKCFRCPLSVRNDLQNLTGTSPEVSSTAMISSESSNNDFQQEVSRISAQEVIRSINDAVNMMSQSEDRTSILYKLFSKAIFVTGAPISMVEHPLWKTFFDKLDPNFKLPNRKMISTDLLDKTYKEFKKEVTEELKLASHLHLQVDGWSNIKNEGILNFIITKPEHVFVSSVNTTYNRHTAEYLTTKILEVLRTYGPNKFVSIIGDNASNLQKAFQNVKQSHYDNIVILNCNAHTLNLLCHDCIKIVPIQPFISLAVDVIKKIKKSQHLNALLAAIVKDKKCGEQLKLPCKTRWGSYVSSLKSLKNTKAALQTLAVHENSNCPAGTRDTLLDPEFWMYVDDSIKILYPISEKIFMLESNKCNINEVYMAFKNIKSQIEFTFPECVMLNDDNKRKIIDAVAKRTKMCIKPIHMAAYLLDPKTQGNELNESDRIESMEFIHEMGRKYNIDVMEDLANYLGKNGLWSKSFVWNSVETIEPVVWWRGICGTRPLSKIAVKILTAASTSAATDRSFSLHGHIHSKKRNRLTTERAAKIAYISYNWNLIEKHQIIEDESDGQITSSLPSSPVAHDISAAGRSYYDSDDDWTNSRIELEYEQENRTAIIDYSELEDIPNLNENNESLEFITVDSDNTFQMV